MSSGPAGLLGLAPVGCCVLYLGSSFQGSFFFGHATFIVFRNDLCIDPLYQNY